MDPQRFAQRPKKARKWLRTREVERLRVLNLQLDIQALRTEIRTLEVARSLLLTRERLNQGAETAERPERSLSAHSHSKSARESGPTHPLVAETQGGVCGYGFTSPHDGLRGQLRALV